MSSKTLYESLFGTQSLQNDCQGATGEQPLPTNCEIIGEQTIQIRRLEYTIRNMQKQIHDLNQQNKGYRRMVEDQLSEITQRVVQMVKRKIHIDYDIFADKQLSKDIEEKVIDLLSTTKSDVEMRRFISTLFGRFIETPVSSASVVAPSSPGQLSKNTETPSELPIQPHPENIVADASQAVKNPVVEEKPGDIFSIDELLLQLRLIRQQGEAFNRFMESCNSVEVANNRLNVYKKMISQLGENKDSVNLPDTKDNFPLSGTEEKKPYQFLMVNNEFNKPDATQSPVGEN